MRKNTVVLLIATYALLNHGAWAKPENGDIKIDLSIVISGLSRESSETEFKDAIRVVYATDVEGLLVLSAKVADQTPGSKFFADSRVVNDPDTGRIVPYQPSAGEILYLLLRNRIDGDIPKMLSRYYSQDRDSIHQWLETQKMKGASLPEMRINAARKSLAKAREKDYEPAIRFFEKKLAELKRTE